MIRGIGTDIISIARVEAALAKHDAQFVQRILTPSEQLHYEARKHDTAYLAKRFAAKEAVAKALGCGIGEQLSFQDIEISNLPSGAPEVVISRQPFEKLKAHLSLSDEKEYAVAFVVIEE